MLFDDELASQRTHEQHAEPSAEERQEKDAPVLGVERIAEKNQRGHGEDHARSQRFARRAGGLHDVVFEDRGASEGAQDADGKNGDGNRSGDGEPGAQAYVDGDRAEKNPKQRTEDDRAQGEFTRGFFRTNERLEFSGCGSGVPNLGGQRVSRECGAPCEWRSAR